MGVDGGVASGIGRMLDLVREHLDMDVAFVSEFVGSEWVLRHISTDDARLEAGLRAPLEETYCKRITDGRIDCVIPDAAADRIDEAIRARLVFIITLLPTARAPSAPEARPWAGARSQRW